MRKLSKESPSPQHNSQYKHLIGDLGNLALGSLVFMQEFQIEGGVCHNNEGFGREAKAQHSQVGQIVHWALFNFLLAFSEKENSSPDYCLNDFLVKWLC